MAYEPRSVVSTDEEFARVRFKTITLTDAQIKALPTAAVEVVPAAGAGKMIDVVRVILHANLVAGYTNIDPDQNRLSAVYQTSGEAASGSAANISADFVADVAELLEGATNRVDILGPLAQYAASDSFILAGTPYEQTDVANNGISISMTNAAAGNLTGGNAANTLKVTVLYMIFDV